MMSLFIGFFLIPVVQALPVSAPSVVFNSVPTSTTIQSLPVSSSLNSTIRISFVGDIIIHEDLYKKVAQMPKPDFSIIWKTVNPFFAKADFSYANLEGPTALGINKNKVDLGDIGFKYDKDIYSGTDLLFNYHPQLILDLKNSGIDIVSTANNHTFDRGQKGIDKTIDALDQYQMPYVGTRKAGSTKDLFTLTQIKELNVAWVACSEMLNGFKDRKSQLLLCKDQSLQMIELIKTLKARKDIDFIIVTPHWGDEYKHEPTVFQKTQAKLFLDAGALVVIGSHPHVLQPVEKHVTPDGRETFIAYSLGNFVAYQRDIDRRSSAVVFLDFTKSSADGVVRISKYSYEPTHRSRTVVSPARDKKDVVDHVQQFLGPLTEPL